MERSLTYQEKKEFKETLKAFFNSFNWKFDANINLASIDYAGPKKWHTINLNTVVVKDNNTQTAINEIVFEILETITPTKNFFG